ncbi:MAG: S1C family serine protease [Chitinophagales bacterium]
MKKVVFWGLVIVLVFSIGFGSAYLVENFSGNRLILQANSPKVQGSVIQVARVLSPSIVGITSYGEEGDFFSRRTVEKSGSGVVTDALGYIVTNNHVIEGSNKIVVVLPKGQKKEAKLVGSDKRTDLALLKVPNVRLTPAHFGNSDKLSVGEGVVAIGNPLGIQFARSVTAGVISGLNRVLTTEQGFVFRLIQTDAAINPGNSGGALANLAGDVVGINTIKISVSGFEGMGFAIPANQVKEVIKELRTRGRVVRPAAGLKIIDELSPQVAQIYNLPVNQGVAVMPVKGGAAEKAGLKNYDIVEAVNGHKVGSAYDLQDCIFGCKAGDEVTIKVVRIPRNSGDKMKRIKVKLKLDSDGIR